MTPLEILAFLSNFLQSGMGMSVAGLSLFAMTWIGGKGLTLLFKMPITRRILGYGLKSAGVPAVIMGKWFQAGPLHLLSGPIVCVFVFAGFWFFSFMDRLLSYLKPETLEMVFGLEKMLEEMGSSDRRLYIMAKTMKPAQVDAVAKMAAAVAAPPSELTPAEKDILTAATVIGRDVQATRLAN
jgi:hypothetical protein